MLSDAPPTGRTRVARTRRGALAAMVLIASISGCAAGAGSDVAASGAPAASSERNTVGQVTVLAPANNPDAPALRVRAAALYPGAPGGGEELRMSVTNDSAAPEHLYAITTAHAASVQLFAAPAVPGGQPGPEPAAGIALMPGTTTAFGPGGPRIRLNGPVALSPGRPITLTLAFALAGLVHLTVAPVASASGTTPVRRQGTDLPGMTKEGRV